MKRTLALFITSFLLLSGIAAGNDISLDRLNLAGQGPLSFLTRFFAESSSPVMLLNHFMRQDGPLPVQPEKQDPVRSKTASPGAACLPDGASPKISISRTVSPLPVNAGPGPLLPCFAVSPLGDPDPPGSSGSSGYAGFIPLFLLVFFVVLSRSNLPAAALLLSARTSPDLVRPGRVFYLPGKGPDDHVI